MTETRIYRDKQDRTCREWQLLLDYIDKIADEGLTEFNPGKDLGATQRLPVTEISCCHY